MQEVDLDTGQLPPSALADTSLTPDALSPHTPGHYLGGPEDTCDSEAAWLKVEKIGRGKHPRTNVSK